MPERPTGLGRLQDAAFAGGHGGAALIPLQLRGLTLYGPDQVLVRDLDLQVSRGERWALLGRNGAGKSSLLRRIAGLPAQGGAPGAGEVWLGMQSLEALSLLQRAQRRGFCPQRIEDAFGMSVRTAVLAGRAPHQMRWGRHAGPDLERVADGLAELDLADFAERDVRALSGGERQRVAIAALLAQDVPLMLLDEPTAHLDPPHREQVLAALARRCAAGAAVMMALHDPDLAGRWATHVLMLQGGGQWLAGPVAQVMSEPTLTALYGVAVRQIRLDGKSRWLCASGD